MTNLKVTPVDAVLVAIDVSKLRNDVLIEMPIFLAFWASLGQATTIDLHATAVPLRTKLNRHLADPSAPVH